MATFVRNSSKRPVLALLILFLADDRADLYSKLPLPMFVTYFLTYVVISFSLSPYPPSFFRYLIADLTYLAFAASKALESVSALTDARACCAADALRTTALASILSFAALNSASKASEMSKVVH